MKRSIKFGTQESFISQQKIELNIHDEDEEKSSSSSEHENEYQNSTFAA